MKKVNNRKSDSNNKGRIKLTVSVLLLVLLVMSQRE